RAQQRVRLGRFAGGEGLPSGADLAEPPRLIVLLADVPLPDPARDALHRAVDSGATLLPAPPSDASEPDWPGFRSLVASEAPTVEALDAPLTMRWTDAVDAPAQSDGLAPSDALDEMTRAPARRRLRLTPRAGSVTLAAYDDGAPAIVATRLGAGRIVA